MANSPDIQDQNPNENSTRGESLHTIIIVAIVVIVVVVAILALLGPSTGKVFSNILVAL
jgi:hypothetical protein